MSVNPPQMGTPDARQPQMATISVSHAGGAAAAYPALDPDQDLNELQFPLSGLNPSAMDQISPDQFLPVGGPMFDVNSFFDGAPDASDLQGGPNRYYVTSSSHEASVFDVGDALLDYSGENSHQSLQLGLTTAPWSHLPAAQGRNSSNPGSFLPTPEDDLQPKAKRPRTASLASGKASFWDSTYSTLTREPQNEDDPLPDLPLTQTVDADMNQDGASSQRGQQHSFSQYFPQVKQADLSSTYPVPEVTHQAFNEPLSSPPRNNPLQQRGHTSQRLQYFQCEECPHKAKTRSELNKHNARHEKRFKCTFEDCIQHKKGFPTHNDLDRHLKSVHHINTRNSKYYKCFGKECGKADKTWPRQDNFRQHLKAMHGTEDMEKLMLLSHEWFEQQQQLNDGSEPIHQPSHQSIGDASEVDAMVNFQPPIPQQYQESVYSSSQGILSQQGVLDISLLDPSLLAPQTQMQRVRDRRVSNPIPRSMPQRRLQRPVPLSLNTMNPLQLNQPMKRTQSQVAQAQYTGSYPGGGGLQQNVNVFQTLNSPWIPSQMMSPFHETQHLGIPQPMGARRPHTTPDPNLDPHRMFTDFATSPIEVSAFDDETNQEAWLSNIGGSIETGGLHVSSQPPAVVVHPPSDDPRPGTELLGKVFEDEINHFLQIRGTGAIDERSLTHFTLALRASLNSLVNPDKSSQSINEGAVDLDPGSAESKHSSQENPGMFVCTYEGCSKVSKRLSGLKKHLKRHEKPFGCTFDGCDKVSGSAHDWKRHEQGQHQQQECWRCHKCTKVFYHDQNNFIAHLKEDHFVTDADEARKRADACRISRSYQGQFWCGFCSEIIVHGHQSVEAVTYRFEHISAHFREGLTNGSWVELSGLGKTKAMLKEEARLPAFADAEDEDDEDDEENASEHQTQADVESRPASFTSTANPVAQSTTPTTVVSSLAYPLTMAEDSKESMSDDCRTDHFGALEWNQQVKPTKPKLTVRSNHSRSIRQQVSSAPTRSEHSRAPQSVICCNCSMAYSLALTKICVDCNHPLCPHCKPDVRGRRSRIPPDFIPNDTNMSL